MCSTLVALDAPDSHRCKHPYERTSRSKTGRATGARGTKNRRSHGAPGRGRKTLAKSAPNRTFKAALAFAKPRKMMLTEKTSVTATANPLMPVSSKPSNTLASSAGRSTQT